MAFVSGRCVFFKSFSMQLPIFILEFLAGYAYLILFELGLKEDNLNLVSKGLKVNFKKDLDFSKLKLNNRNINNYKSIVRNYLNSLEESGSISRKILR